MSAPTTIDQVLDDLADIVERTRTERSRLGFFAALYRQVTLGVREGVAQGFFDDGARMERLDVAFAERYLEAYATWLGGGQPSEVWRVAFATSSAGRVTILQDLLLGINAHINLDLGIAAAQIAPGDALPALQGDFDKINTILHALIAPAEQAIERFSPFIKLLDEVGGRLDDVLVDFSLRAARDQAWHNARILAREDPHARDATITVMDRGASLLGRHLAAPGFPLDDAIKVVRLAESRDVPAIIDALDALTETTTAG
jgi:hypothetical protein